MSGPLQPKKRLGTKICGVFRPVFGCLQHPKAGRNNIFCTIVPVCIHSTFACQSLPLSSPLSPSLRCRLLHTVDKAVARSCIVFLVTTKIYPSRHYNEKRRSRDREVNPRPLEWQASMLPLDHATPLDR